MNLADSRLNELDHSPLNADQRVLLRCRLAAELIHIGQFESAREALGDLWRGVGLRPVVAELEETTVAEVLLQCGSLSGWLRESRRVQSAQDAAKDLISEALRVFSLHGRQTRVAEAQYELGVCYWRAGAFDEARVILQDALRKLGGCDSAQKAKILIRSTIVEISEGRYNDALKILDEAAPLFDTASDALKGRWHGQRALVLRRLGTAMERADYLDRAIIEYTAAIFHFEQARHERYCGNAENNFAFLLYKLGKYEEAHQHLDRAQKLFLRLEDAGSLAQVRETRARVLLAEKRYDKATDMIKSAVGTLDKIGEKALLADALVVQANIEAKQGQPSRAILTFRKAIKVARDAGALKSAGLAALSLLEQYGTFRLSEDEVYETYCLADDLLKNTQDGEAIARLRACARLLACRFAVVRVGGQFSLSEALKASEAKFIARALKESGGKVSHAAKLLGINRQKLAYLLETRHPDLLPARSPVVKRRRGIVKKSK
jgi:tetratricopeptide (TPR) repeat protein